MSGIDDPRPGGRPDGSTDPTRLDDDALIELLAQALGSHRKVPEHVSTTAGETWSWADADASMAQLVFDSSSAEPAGVRGTPSESRNLVFSAGDLEVDLLVGATGGRAIEGQLIPGRFAFVELFADSWVQRGFTDDLGRFGFSVERPTQVHLRFHVPGGTNAATPTFELG